LNFVHQESVTAQSAIALSHAIMKLVQLTQLTLNFGNTPITDEGMKSLSTALSALTKLNQISLILYETQITDATMEYLPMSLSSLTGLTLVSLNCEANNFTNQGIILLSTYLSRMKQLNQLYLNFASHTTYGGINETGINSLSASISVLTKLTMLNLIFSGHQLIDEGIVSLSQNLSNMTKLTQLSFDFSNNQLTDVAINATSQILSELQGGLRAISLNFQVSKNITEEAIDVLLETLSKLPNLRQLFLGFQQNGITQAEYLKISEFVEKVNGH